MKLEFSSPKVVDRFSFEELSSVEQQQFVIAAANALGLSEPGAIFESCESEDRIWELYTAKDADTGTSCYQVWILGIDAGTVFESGTGAETFIEFLGDGFRDTVEPGDDSDARAEIVEALDDAYGDASHFDDEPGAWDNYWEAFNRKKDAI